MAIDKLTIDTPEQVPLEFMLAGIGSRFMAAFLDILIELLVYLALILLTLLWWRSGWLTGSRSIWWEALISLVRFASTGAITPCLRRSGKARHRASAWAGIRVIKDSGRPINVFEAISRNLIRFVDFCLCFTGSA